MEWMMKRYVARWIGFAMLLAACVPVSAPTAAVGTPAELPPTQSLIPTEYITEETAPGQTPPVVDFTPPAGDQTPTQWWVNADEIFAGQQAVTLETSDSPDGEWRAEVQRFDCVAYGSGEQGEQVALEQILLTRLPDGEAKVIEEQPLLCQGLGAFGLGEIDWSENGRYLYYTTAREGVPDGGGGCGWFRPLTAYELTSGQVTEISEGVPSPAGNLMAAPETSRDSEKYELILWDKEEGDEYRLAMLDPDMALASIAWRADGGQLVYLQTDAPCGVPGSQSLLVRYNLTSEEQDTLLETDEHAFVAVEWPEEKTLLLRTAAGETIQYDLNTFSLIP